MSGLPEPHPAFPVLAALLMELEETHPGISARMTERLKDEETKLTVSRIRAAQGERANHRAMEAFEESLTWMLGFKMLRRFLGR